LLHLFDAKVDGNDARRLGIKGKPAPDVFLCAARQLGVEPAHAIVVEDAISGVEAGRAGGFGLVVGVNRGDAADGLWAAGADLVVRDLRELETARRCPPGENCLKTPSSALRHVDWIANEVGARGLALFLDYDGTLTPIVRRPEEATLSSEMRRLLGELGEQCAVAIVSGRDRRNVEQMVRVEGLVYAGSHGFDIRGPGGLEMQHADAQSVLGELDEAERKLRAGIQGIDGAHVERKRYAIAVHYREVVAAEDVRRVEKVVDEVRGQHAGLRKRGGKKVFELQPDIEWHKGYAVMWLAETLGLNRDGAAIIYIGDDETDEDAFRALRERGAGIGILVAPEPAKTCATYYLRDCDEVYQFLSSLAGALRKKTKAINNA
jgi:trehalose 6-phosphate phosphatase